MLFSGWVLMRLDKAPRNAIRQSILRILPVSFRLLKLMVSLLIGRAANYKGRTPSQFRFSLNARSSVAAMHEFMHRFRS